PHDFCEIPFKSAADILPAPGTVRSITNFGMATSWVKSCNYQQESQSFKLIPRRGAPRLDSRPAQPWGGPLTAPPLTIHGVPNLSTHMPKPLAQKVGPKGMKVWPPSANASNFFFASSGVS